MNNLVSKYFELSFVLFGFLGWQKFGVEGRLIDWITVLLIKLFLPD